MDKSTRVPTRTLAVALAVLLVSASVAAPVAAAPLDESAKLSGSAADAFGIVRTDLPDTMVEYGGDGTPGWYVTTRDNKTSAVEEWANGSDSRTVRSIDAESNRVLVSAPADDIGGTTIARTLNSGLLSEDYVTAVDLNVRLGNADPVTSLQSEEDYGVPFDRRLGVLTARGSASLNTDGVAFGNEVNTTTFDDVTDVTAADSLHSDNINGSDVEVAVIDTGTNVANGEVFGNGSTNSTIRITHAYNTITDEAAVASNDYENVSDGNGHGTWVAAAAAGSNGMAPDANLQVYKALNDDGEGTTENIIQAIERADTNGADVIAMSLGSPVSNAALADEVREALEGNVSAVSVAVGNSRQTTRWVASPADVDGVIGVAASTTDAPSTAESAYFSNVGPDSGTDNSRFETRGELPDVSAPGMEIEAEVVTTDGRVRNRTLSGTSMAQPFVAGSVALLLEDKPDLEGDHETVQAVVANASSPAPNMGVTETGYGMLNASNMVDGVYPETDQRDARDEPATSRDNANVGLAGYPDAHAARAEA